MGSEMCIRDRSEGKGSCAFFPLNSSARQCVSVASCFQLILNSIHCPYVVLPKETKMQSSSYGVGTVGGREHVLINDFESTL